ncbi:hypothetical protein PGT21_030382 [Puccinia graminis f. sp. tritici]|uniref:Uncharacterized protein n=1 Tax=Puccinia graminis f. sp. tritici TaxID=56615 RepID=A0A5B0Q771_PUCGR|nr:hypothetical protein PGT21_030382 [Puccinia graminis f. sp. tritici]KAA1122521.1 hypothetical protein PGTUg99_037736 [Puccinia graminis f. sp. tritici]
MTCQLVEDESRDELRRKLARRVAAAQAGTTTGHSAAHRSHPEGLNLRNQACSDRPSGGSVSMPKFDYPQGVISHWPDTTIERESTRDQASPVIERAYSPWPTLSRPRPWSVLKDQPRAGSDVND